ncbi:MAG: hypothetical protein WC514_03280 [Candidatus Paceibacterota bacterium]
MRRISSKIVFLIHCLIVFFWFGLFFVPVSLWSDKIIFHFYLTLVIVFNQFIWGLFIMPWTKKYRMVCFLTTVNQLLRGDSISDEKKYDHSFSQELFGKAGIKITHRFATYLTFTVLIVVTFQYLSLK